MSNVIEQLKDYSNLIRTYRNPPVAPPVVRSVLVALGHPNDYVESLYVVDKDTLVTITVGWYIRGCEQSEDYDIPMSVFLADDPPKAAKIWQLEDTYAEETRKLAEAEHSVQRYRDNIVEIQKEINQLKS